MIRRTKLCYTKADRLLTTRPYQSAIDRTQLKVIKLASIIIRAVRLGKCPHLCFKASLGMKL